MAFLGFKVGVPVPPPDGRDCFLKAEVDLKYVKEPSCEAKFFVTAFFDAERKRSSKRNPGSMTSE